MTHDPGASTDGDHRDVIVCCSVYSAKLGRMSDFLRCSANSCEWCQFFAGGICGGILVASPVARLRDRRVRREQFVLFLVSGISGGRGYSENFFPSDEVSMSIQAIAGVSPSAEATIMTVYPSICATAPGRLIGQICDSMPIRIFGPRLSMLLFGLPLALLGAPLYLLVKGFSHRYILTNRSVQVWTCRGGTRISSVDLGQIEAVNLVVRPGQEFFRAADIRLTGAGGKTLLVLPGIPDAGTIRSAIQRAVQARRLVQSSLATISARG